MRLALTAVLVLAAARAAAQENVDRASAQESVDEGDAPEEAESSMAQPVGPDLLYTREITDPELARKFRDDREGFSLRC